MKRGGGTRGRGGGFARTRPSRRFRGGGPRNPAPRPRTGGPEGGKVLEKKRGKSQQGVKPMTFRPSLLGRPPGLKKENCLLGGPTAQSGVEGKNTFDHLRGGAKNSPPNPVPAKGLT